MALLRRYPLGGQIRCVGYCVGYFALECVLETSEDERQGRSMAEWRVRLPIAEAVQWAKEKPPFKNRTGGGGTLRRGRRRPRGGGTLLTMGGKSSSSE